MPVAGCAGRCGSFHILSAQLWLCFNCAALYSSIWVTFQHLNEAKVVQSGVHVNMWLE